jgi:hypothetical protein
MRYSTFLSLALVLPLTIVPAIFVPQKVVAQTQIPTNPPSSTSAEAKALKVRILSIAFANQTRQDNLQQVRAKLDPLIKRLVAITPPRTEPEKLYQVLGAWYQVWSDAPFYQPIPSGSYDLKHIYQVVFNGYYWNIARFLPINQGVNTQFLRGTFRVTPESLQPVVFTKDVFGVGDIPRRSDVITYAIRAESGEYDAQPTSGFTPVGLPQLPLVNLYVDNDFRILTNPPSSDNPEPVIFVFLRTSALPSN